MKFSGKLQDVLNGSGIEAALYMMKNKELTLKLEIVTPTNYTWDYSANLSVVGPSMTLGEVAEKMLNIWSSFDIEAEVERHKGDIGNEDGCDSLEQLVGNIRYVEKSLDSMMEKASVLFSLKGRAFLPEKPARVK